MWVLVLILINVVPGLEKTTVLAEFPSQQDCLIERDRVGFEMAESYPYDRDFVIVCQLLGVKA